MRSSSRRDVCGGAPCCLCLGVLLLLPPSGEAQTTIAPIPQLNGAHFQITVLEESGFLDIHDNDDNGVVVFRLPGGHARGPGAPGSRQFYLHACGHRAATGRSACRDCRCRLWTMAAVPNNSSSHRRRPTTPFTGPSTIAGPATPTTCPSWPMFRPTFTWACTT